ncbi:hypothetical protein V2J09_000590 [Rumex salicifolius]
MNLTRPLILNQSKTATSHSADKPSSIWLAVGGFSKPLIWASDEEQPTIMEKLSLSSAASPSPTFFLSPLSINKLTLATSSRTRTLSFNPRTRPRRFVIVACNDGPRNKLTEADLMEFKFGQMLGEDPKLTIAKIMGRKVNPDASYLEIEKNFYRNNGKMVEVKEVPFDVPKRRGSLNSKNELKLVKTVPKPGIKVGAMDDSSFKERKPSGKKVSSSKSNVPNVVLRKPGVYYENDDPKLESLELCTKPNLSLKLGNDQVGAMDDSGIKERKPSGKTVSSISKSNVPNIILRKPSVYNEADDPMAESLKLRIKPNLSLQMRTDQVKEKFGGMTLLKRPEPINLNADVDGNPDSSGNGDEKSSSGVEEFNLPEKNVCPSTVVYPAVSKEMEGAKLKSVDKLLLNQECQVHESSSNLPILEKPKPFIGKNTETSTGDSLNQTFSIMEKNFSDFLEPIVDDTSSHKKQDGSGIEMQPCKPTYVEPSVHRDNMSEPPAKEPLSPSPFNEVALKGKPQRSDQSVKPISNRSSMDRESFVDEVEWMDFSQISTIKEHEDTDWQRGEQLSKIGYRVEVELISCSARGFAVSFGSLIGFLPYRNMTDRFKFFAFPSWLRKKGLDPTKYKQNMGIVGSYDLLSNNAPLKPSNSEIPTNSEVEIGADMELQDLLKIYDQEKIRFLSSFVGQRMKVYVSLADKKSRRLTFSLKPKEKVEMVEKKRNLMARLSIGDVVKCSITKITFFGIFVEVEGVPALIHQTEVSWDSSVNPALDFKIGQILEAKVIELDYPLERISLSLKDITPDPMSEALECVVGDNNTLSDRFESSQTDAKWAEVDSLIKELESVDGVQSVSKGRFFMSPALAPTFQVYMASVFETQYKLLARAGNKGQEVIVESSLGKEEMKTAILTCTNRPTPNPVSGSKKTCPHNLQDIRNKKEKDDRVYQVPDRSAPRGSDPLHN